ncbi:inositol 2-dehydrogenase [Devriesea agamarum]|uniref:inositol 2-dehydrogenase n=1 Tax=Devriesea agamarum TaxID=472569 RepID=UPI00071C49C0|nr:inositol 2-dehydrogenase [Devriesea agamarum]
MTRIALIGAGRIGTVHARAVSASPGVELALVCDPFEDRAAQIASVYGADHSADLQDAFRRDDVDAVIIGSPTPFHVEHILAAVSAGKRVLCEKPVALDLDQAKRCLDELGDQAQHVMMGFNRRFDPTFAEIHQRVQQGEIGDLQQLTIVSRDPAAPPVEYVATSGGLFKDMTIHDFDMARHFLGDIAGVSARGTVIDPAIGEQGDIDQAIVTLWNAAGRTAVIVNSRTCAYGYDQRLEAFGATGSLSADNLTATAVRRADAQTTLAKGPVLDFFLARYADAYRIEIEAFLKAAKTGEPVSPSVIDGYEALRVAEAAGQSLAQGGNPVSL